MHRNPSNSRIHGQDSVAQQEPVQNPFQLIAHLREQLAAALQLAGLKTTEETYFYVQIGRKLQKVSFDEIIWIESERNCVAIYTTRQVFSAYLTLSQVEERLPQSLFVRIHKSLIVSIARVDSIHKDQVGIRRGDEEMNLPIGALYKKTVIQKLEQNILKNKNSKLVL